MLRGRTIRIYLIDGTSTGAMAVEIMNWTGITFAFPRSKMPEIARRSEVHRTGIYLLVGADPEHSVRTWAYIGEADDVIRRLAIHDRDDRYDFWERTYVIVSKDENLTKAHARYLESRLIQLAREAGRARLENNTAPALPVLPEPDVADMEYFFEQIVMVLPVLGLSALQPIPATEPAIKTEAEMPTFELNATGTRALARNVDGQFVVLKGSTARRGGVASWTSYRGLREELVENGKLIESEDAENLVFSENVGFNSPSAAAAVVLGRNSNGRIYWKVAGSNLTYADWQAGQLRDAGIENDDIKEPC